jgi:hypothetical protein
MNEFSTRTLHRGTLWGINLSSDTRTPKARPADPSGMDGADRFMLVMLVVIFVLILLGAALALL